MIFYSESNRNGEKLLKKIFVNFEIFQVFLLETLLLKITNF